MNTELTLYDPSSNLIPVMMNSKDMAEIIGKRHNNVIQDIKTVVIEVVAEDGFLENTITGGLSSTEYIRRNSSVLFDVFYAKKDDLTTSHKIFQGVTEVKDHRGYTKHFELSKTAIITFMARTNSKEAFKLATYVDHLEDEIHKKQMEAITNRVENDYRVKEISFDDMSHRDIRKMYTNLSESQKRTMVHNIKAQDLDKEILRLLLHEMMRKPEFFYAIGNAQKGNTTHQIEHMKAVPQTFLPKNTTPVEDNDNFVKETIEKENYRSISSDYHWSVADVANDLGMTCFELWKYLYKHKYLKNGEAKTYPHFKPSNIHQDPYATYNENNQGYMFIEHDYSGNRQLRISIKGKKHLLKKFANNKLF